MWEPLTVTAEGDALVLGVGPDGKAVYPMTHFDLRPSSWSTPTGKWPACLSPVTFAVGPDGKATAITIDNLGVSGLGCVG